VLLKLLFGQALNFALLEMVLLLFYKPLALLHQMVLLGHTEPDC
jgi:hypothetical protein